MAVSGTVQDDIASGGKENTRFLFAVDNAVRGGITLERNKDAWSLFDVGRAIHDGNVSG